MTSFASFLSFITLFLIVISSEHLVQAGRLPKCPVPTTAAECTDASLRIDCHPDPGASPEKCASRGCIWCVAEDGAPAGTPWCYTPPTMGYRMDGPPIETELGLRLNLTRASNGSYFGNDFERLTVDFEYWDYTHLRIKIYPTGVQRYEVPLSLQVAQPTKAIRLQKYVVEVENDPVFSFRVRRKESYGPGTTILDTSMGGLVFSSQFIQFSTKLPSENVYGIGENEQHSFRHEFSRFQRFALWARDQVPDGNTNVYGVQPLYTVIEHDGNAHSVMIVNSNAMEFVMMPAPGYTYRTIGGLLDMHVFLGPTPENTVQQFTKLVGRAPIPPYWALGFQLCRWGYNNLTNMQAAVNRTRQYRIPHDVQYGDIDIMDRSLDFTISPDRFGGLAEYVLALKADGIKFVTILDPGISPNQTAGTYRPFDYANELEAASEEKLWVRRPDGTPTVGAVWPGDTFYPDYSANITRTWWITMIKEFSQKLAFDGLWIDMNEPASWGKGDIHQGCVVNNSAQPNYNNPPYIPAIKNFQLEDMTICPDATQKFGVHYDTHSLYGWSESEPTLAGVHEALGKRSLVLTRSSYLGVGKWAAHWLGDNFSLWSNLHYSIIGMLSFNLFGVPFVGADICGFNFNSTKELCHRWSQLGAFYAFARNHNGLNNQEQDPGYFGEEVANATREALEIRYTMLPYLNTLFYLHSIHGSTVVRSLAFEFPRDPEALKVDRQFLWGSSFLVSPVLDEGHRHVVAYFPDAVWYHYQTGTKVSIRQDYSRLNAGLDTIPLHVRGGHIFPTQQSALNTAAARNLPFGLIIALDEFGSGIGQLYVDDGESIDPVEVTGSYFHMRFEAASNSCRGTVTHRGYNMTGQYFSTVRLLGVGTVVRVTVGNENHEGVTNLPGGEVRVENLRMELDKGFQMAWYYE